MKIYDVRGIGANLTGSFSGSFKGLFTGPLDGVAATSSYVEYTDVANKPALVSGSSQVLAFNVFTTTGSNQFNGNQSITGSLTVTGQVIAQTLNVQQVTSSIVFSSGSNRFGNNTGNTHSFTGSVRVTGSLTVNGSGLVPYTGATQDVNLGVYSIATNSVLANQITVNPSGTTAAQVFLKHGSSFSLPNGFGSIGSSTGNQFRLYQVSSEGVWRGAGISLNSITPSETRVYTLPDASGTLALTSNLSSYLPLTGGTLTGALNGTSASFIGTIANPLHVETSGADGGIQIYRNVNADGGSAALFMSHKSNAGVINTANIEVVGSGSMLFRTGATGLGNFGTTRLTIASGGAATFSSSVTAQGAKPQLYVIGDSGNGAGIFLNTLLSGTNRRNWAIFTEENIDGDFAIKCSTAAGGSPSAGNTRLQITRDGNVGIGTNSPGANFILDITSTKASGASGMRLTTQSTSAGPIFVFNYTGSSLTNWGIGAHQAIAGALEFVSSNSVGGDPSTAGTTRMLITSAGNVGIGTTSPNSNLEVRSNNSMAYDATSDNGQDDAGATITVRNGNTTTNSFAQIDMQVSGDEGRAVGRIVTIRRGSATSDMAFVTENANTKAEKMRITSTGYVYLGNGFSATNHRINLGVNQGGGILVVSGYESSAPGSANDTAIFYGASGASPNAAATALGVMTNSSTGRSINAGGTINASGADYAEYMTKAVEDNIAKGDIVGIDSDAKVTNIFANAISFAVKSTDPSYVGGDVWGNVVGKRPERTTDQTEEEFAPILAEFEAELEIARAKVDRISFSGQVPCNVMGANVGDYIIPVETENGKIGGQAIPNPTFEQYQIAVGKVWKIIEDGRAWIAVKIG